MSDFIVNKAGAKIYNDLGKHQELEVPGVKNETKNGKVYEVLSVGMTPSRTALITVREGKEAIAYKLPSGLNDWANHVIGMAMSGVKIFPEKVEFGILNGTHYAQILQPSNMPA